MEKIIIDADPGTDDFIALSLAIKSKKFDILGITTVEGNCKLESAVENTFKTLDMCDSKNIKVYKGCKNNYLGTSNADDVHGNNGLGGVEYSKIDMKVEDISAVDYLIDIVKKNPKEITIVALGPLTNISECVKKDKSFASNVGKLVIMGGSASYGNITPYAEFNFYKDPESVDTVLKSNFDKILIFGWDVTTKMPLLEKHENVLKSSNKELPKFIYDITRTTSKHDKNEYGGAVISDPLTIAYLIDNSVATLKCANVNMVLSGEEVGASKVEFVDSSNILFATHVDSDKFYKILFDNIL